MTALNFLETQIGTVENMARILQSSDSQAPTNPYKESEDPL